MLNLGLLRGLLITLFFGVVLFVLIPVHVPRPSFIPGFAPPPDMWPRTVSVFGLTLGILAMALAVLRGEKATAGEPDKTPALPAEWGARLARLALALAAFAGFVTLAPRLGFLPASILLALACFTLAGVARRWVATLVLAVLLPLGLQLFFGTVTHTPFPQGSWGIFPVLP